MNRLAARLLVSYAVVIAVGVLTVFLTVRLLAPYLFDDHMGMRAGGMGMDMGTGMTGLQLHNAFTSALDTALLLGLLASAVAAGAVGAFVARRLLRPIDAVRRATRRLAQGYYTERIPLPRETELAALAGDVNNLAAALADTEQRRVRLISEVAHEMRTPLTTVGGHLEGLLDGVFPPTPEVLTAVSDEVARLRRLASDLAALSRAEEGALDLDLVHPDRAGVRAVHGPAGDRGGGNGPVRAGDVAGPARPGRSHRICARAGGRPCSLSPGWSCWPSPWSTRAVGSRTWASPWVGDLARRARRSR